MILADTSVWVDHLRYGASVLSALLEDAQVMVHPFVIGELACGVLRNRREILDLLANLPAAPVATDHEVLLFIEARALMGRGIGYVDAHLLASVTLADSATLWTRDKRLAAIAAEMGFAFVEAR